MVSGSLSNSDGGSPDKGSTPLAYNETFHKVFPYYLSIGMSADDFWNGDCTLARDYRKADELRRERRNEELWLQGMYIYEALCDTAPIMRSFAKKGTKPTPYTEHPYPITSRAREKEEEAKAKKVAEKGKRMFEALMASSKPKPE